jgi:2-succinyl-5-enolpyruvyl-6-hydroxy-3-cyclohexene-1-carboxylate synthase
MPAAVVCTSGTAVANLLPAALEAHHAGVPLLLLTADRPPELRGVGANQTTRQPGMFAPNMRLEEDLPVPDALDADGTGEQSMMLRRVAEDAVAAALGAGTRQAGPVPQPAAARAARRRAAAVAGRPSSTRARARPRRRRRRAERDRAVGSAVPGRRRHRRGEPSRRPEVDPHVLVRGPHRGDRRRRCRTRRRGARARGRLAADRRDRQRRPLRPQPRPRLPRAAARPGARRAHRARRRLRPSDAHARGHGAAVA